MQKENEIIYFKEGFKCRVAKIKDLGHLCGYLVLPRGHPFYGLPAGRIPIAVHGGITYAEHEEDEFYIGFDCAHYSDLVPGLQRTFPCHGTYKTISYVENEIRNMVRQAKLLDYNAITYKKAGKMILKGSILFYRNNNATGFICDIGDYKSLTHYIVHEHDRYASTSQSPAEVMASTWYMENTNYKGDSYETY